jgi:hypothetical protein
VKVEVFMQMIAEMKTRSLNTKQVSQAHFAVLTLFLQSISLSRNSIAKESFT